MNILPQDTPNPSTKQLLLDRSILDEHQEPVEFVKGTETQASPLASVLLENANIEAVFLGHNFVSITKTTNAQWEEVLPTSMMIVQNHLLTQQPVLSTTTHLQDAPVQHNPEDAEIVAQIQELLDTRVRPAVAQDGGDITFFGFDKGVVYLKMKGACAGCPSSTMTLKMGIENLLRHYIPEVGAVQQVI